MRVFKGQYKVEVIMYHPLISACISYLPQDTYGKLLDVEKHQNQLRAKGLFSEKAKTK